MGKKSKKANTLNFKVISVAQENDLSYVHIVSENQTAQGVIVKYIGLEGNLPNTYKNSVALWRGFVPNMQGTPLLKVDILYDDPIGDVWIPYAFQQSHYSVTYQVGESLQTMCCLSQIDTTQSHTDIKSLKLKNQKKQCVRLKEGTSIVISTIPTYVNLKILELTTDSIKIFYSTLSGYNPAEYNNWIGIWQGYTSPYGATGAMKTIKISSQATEDIIVIDDIKFSEYLNYTLIYFTGPDLNNAAALLYFNVAD